MFLDWSHKLNSKHIRYSDIGVSRSLIEIYQKIYDTLAYRDIVMEPTALSRNHKWENVYKLAYPYIDTLIKRYPNRNLCIPHYDYISASDSISKNKSWHAQDSLRARIRIGRMTGPNQFVFVEIGKNWYREYTIEFSELTYNATQTISSQFMYKKDGNYMPLTVYVNAFFNATPQLELNINVKFNDITTVLKSSFRSQPIKNKDMLPIAKFINKGKAYDYEHATYDDEKANLEKYGYKKVTNEKNLYRGIKQYDHEDAYIVKIPSYYTTYDETKFSWSPDYVIIDKDKKLSTYDIDKPNNYFLYPIGWHEYYTAYGLLIKKYFYSEYPTKKGSCPSGLYSKYDNNDSICIKKNQLYSVLDYMVDSVYIFDGIDTYFNKKEQFDFTVNYDLVEGSNIKIHDTLALVYPFFGGLSKTNSKYYIGQDSMFLVYVNFTGKFNLPFREGTYKYSYSRLYKKSIKLYGLKPKTIYRVYPIYINNYYEENPIKIIRR